MAKQVDQKRIKSQLEFHKKISLTAKHTIALCYLFSLHAADGWRMKLENWIFIYVCFLFIDLLSFCFLFFHLAIMWDSTSSKVRIQTNYSVKNLIETNGLK